MLFLSPGITAYCLVLAFVLGAVFASFLGCMGWRICNGESVLKGRSHCDSCGHVLSAHDLIPIISYVKNKGRCAYCNTQISPMNFYGEVILAVVFVLTTLRYDITWNLVLMLFFVCILYLVSVTDIYEQMIPDSALLVAVGVRVGYFVCVEGASWKGALGLWVDGLAISVPLLILVLSMEKILKKEAMGGGDIKLLFVTGMYLGWAQNLLAIFFACIIGIIIGMVQMKKQTEESEESIYFPFGPAIAIGAVLSLLFGEQLIGAYLSLF